MCVNIQENSGIRFVVIALSFYMILALSLGVHMKFSNKSIFQYSSYIAYVEIKNGEAADYYSTYEERLSILEKGNRDIFLPEYNV